MWCLYILECGDGTFYTGITNDLDKRIKNHRARTAARYTRGRQPLHLRYTEPHPNRASASRREHQVKAMTRTDKEKLISSQP